LSLLGIKHLRNVFIINQEIRDYYITGGFFGIISKAIAAPIERVKLFLQKSRENTKLTSQYKGIADCFAGCVR
jgi:hypothetical protein